LEEISWEKIIIVVVFLKWRPRGDSMSWFQERAAYAAHMNYREKNPNRYVKKYGTNKHSDHSKVLSNDLKENQRLVDTLFYQLMDILPNTSISLPYSIQIQFEHQWQEHNDNDCSVIGCRLPFKSWQKDKLLRGGRIIISNWGNRGEPASVYDDAFSRFLIFEIQRQRSKVNFDGLTQYGFHKFLNAKYANLLPDYKLLGVSKEIKPKILTVLENVFDLKVENDSIILPVVQIKDGNQEELLNLIKHLFIVGLVKESYRGRLPELYIG
jgi:hypothetical protein